MILSTTVTLLTFQFWVTSTNGLIPNTLLDMVATGWQEPSFPVIKFAPPRKTSSFPHLELQWGRNQQRTQSWLAHAKQFLLLPSGELCLLTPSVSNYWFISTHSTSHRHSSTAPAKLNHRFSTIFLDGLTSALDGLSILKVTSMVNLEEWSIHCWFYWK